MAVLGIEKFKRINPFKTQISIETLPEGTESESETVSDEFDGESKVGPKKSKRNHSPLKKRLFGKFDSPMKKTEMDAEVGSILGFKRGRNRPPMIGGAGRLAERLKKRNAKKEIRKIQRIENNALEKIFKIKNTEKRRSPTPGLVQMGGFKVVDRDTADHKAKKALYKAFARFAGVNAPLMKGVSIVSKDDFTVHKRPKWRTLSPSKRTRYMPSINDFAHSRCYNKPAPMPKRPDYLEAIIIRREIAEKRKSKDRNAQRLAMFQKHLTEARSKFREKRDSLSLAQKIKKQDMEEYLRPFTQMLADNNIGLSLKDTDSDQSMTKGLFAMIRKEMAGSRTVTELAMGLGMVAQSIQEFEASKFNKVSKVEACQPRQKAQTDIRARFFSRGKSPLQLGKTAGEGVGGNESFRLGD